MYWVNENKIVLYAVCMYKVFMRCTSREGVPPEKGNRAQVNWREMRWPEEGIGTRHWHRLCVDWRRHTMNGWKKTAVNIDVWVGVCHALVLYNKMNWTKRGSLSFSAGLLMCAWVYYFFFYFARIESWYIQRHIWILNGTISIQSFSIAVFISFSCMFSHYVINFWGGFWSIYP